MTFIFYSVDDEPPGGQLRNLSAQFFNLAQDVFQYEETNFKKHGKVCRIFSISEPSIFGPKHPLGAFEPVINFLAVKTEL
jgi:hypothetical protein